MLAQTLERGEILVHPFVIGEISLGNLADRRDTLAMLSNMPMAIIASPNEIAHFIEAEGLYGLGVGYIDVHLLASTLLTRDAKLWTRDRRLRSVAERLGIAARQAH